MLTKSYHPLILLTLLSLALLKTEVCAKRSTENFDLNEVYPLGVGGTIHLNTHDADVRITGGDRSDVHLIVAYEAHTSGLFWESKGKSFGIEVTPEGGDLYIEEVNADKGRVGIMISSERKKYEVTLEVPKDAHLKLRGDDDDYEIRTIQGKIELTFDDGQASIEECDAEDFDLKTEDGCIDMKGGKGRLEASCEDGSISVADGAFLELRAETEDGDIEIATSLADGGSYVLESEDGGIELTVTGGGGEFRIKNEDGRVSASSDFTAGEEDENLVVYTLAGGSAKVRIRTEDGRVRLSKR